MIILLVEDEPKIASFIEKGLKEEGYAVTLAHDGAIGKQLALHGNFDLIILDVLLPSINGFELCQQLRKEGIQQPILLLTALNDAQNVVTGLDMGADDFLPKPFKFQVLLARIRALIRRSQTAGTYPATNQKLQMKDLVMDVDARTVFRIDKAIALSPKEFRLLEYMLRNQNRVLTRVELLENVWDLQFDTGTNVVDVYVNYLRNKIDKNFEEKYIHTVFGIGYILKEESGV